MNNILRYFPNKIEDVLKDAIGEKYNSLEEIRVRVQKPIILKFDTSEKIVRYLCNPEEILNILQAICENSIYTYQKQIAEGFVTISGGHRVGISGSCVIENGQVININYINSLNFRISREVFGASKKVLKHILKLEENTVNNTLIVSPPGAGKTTLLRDLVRQISNGIKDYKFKGLNIGLVDERGEIASLYKGISQNDVGLKTDVIENVSKNIGMKMLIRSMAPQVIVADEIGNYDDVEIINYAICSGCKGIFTAHGSNFDDIYLNPVLKNLVNIHIFETIIFLDIKNKGNLKDVYLLNKKSYEYEKYNESKEI